MFRLAVDNSIIRNSEELVKKKPPKNALFLKFFGPA